MDLAPPPVTDEQIQRADADDRAPRPVDRMLHAAVGRMTGGLSPASLSAAYADWFVHLLGSPGKQQQLFEKAWRKSVRLGLWAAMANKADCPPCIEPLAQDRRFRHPSWQRWPSNLLYQAFLLTQQWWHVATTGVSGVTRHHEQVVEFATRQLLDIVSPSNFVATNPELLQHTLAKGGANLVQGAQNGWEDAARKMLGRPPVGTEKFQVGLNVAATPGKIVMRNALVELIQYTPATEQVYPEPVLIVPAWIMKYYILDLSAHNSLVKYLVDQGHTVFMISWKNPDAGDRNLGLDDYLELGLKASIDAISTMRPQTPIHACGYCLGGTLLAIGAAAMARDGDERLKSVSLLAAQTDFEEPGELSLFIDESQIAFLEDIMWDQGYLESGQMAGAFQLLKSQDLIWSRLVHQYLMGTREPMTDLMAWNADATRMPYRMHSEYLRGLFLDNDLAEGRYRVHGKPVALGDIRLPIFVVGTAYDHVAPWRSVYKIHLLTDTEVTFVLTAGGHNAGIVSEPEHAGRWFQLMTRSAMERYVPADDWLASAPRHEGSWWPAWHDWLAARSGEHIPSAAPGAVSGGYTVLGDAPGQYVRVS